MGKRKDPQWDGQPAPGGPVPPPSPAAGMPPPAPRPSRSGGARATDASRTTIGPQSYPGPGTTPTTPVRPLVEPPPPPREGANPWLIAAIAIGTVALLAGSAGWYFFLRNPNDPTKVELATSTGTTTGGTGPAARRTDDTAPDGTQPRSDGEGDEGTSIPAPPQVPVETPTTTATTAAPRSNNGGGSSSGGGTNGGGGENTGGGGNNGGGGNVTVTTAPTTTQPPAPQITSFTVNNQHALTLLCIGETTKNVDFRWAAVNATTVTLATTDGFNVPGFRPTEEATVEIQCPSPGSTVSTVATLTAFDATGRTDKEQITLTVKTGIT